MKCGDARGLYGKTDELCSKTDSHHSPPACFPLSQEAYLFVYRSRGPVPMTPETGKPRGRKAAWQLLWLELAGGSVLRSSLPTALLYRKISVNRCIRNQKNTKSSLQLPTKNLWTKIKGEMGSYELGMQPSGRMLTQHAWRSRIQPLRIKRRRRLT